MADSLLYEKIKPDTHTQLLSPCGACVNELVVIALPVCVHVMQEEGSDSGYDEPIFFVDHPHPGQGGDFDDEGSATLPGRKDKDRSKGNKK